MALSLPSMVVVMFVLALCISRWLRNRPKAARWARRLARAKKPHMFAAVLAQAWRVQLGKELRMVFWASYPLLGVPGSALCPEHRFGLCVSFGKRATAQQLGYYVSLPSERSEVFIDRTEAQDLARCLARMKLSPNLQYLVVSEKELADRLDQSSDPRAVLRNLLANLDFSIAGQRRQEERAPLMLYGRVTRLPV